MAAAAANLADVKGRLEAAQATETELGEAATAKSAEAEAFRSRVDELRANFGKMQAEAAAKEAELNYLNDAKDAAAAFSAGAQSLLAGKLDLPAGLVLGPLADRFDAPSDLRLALEAALRSWLDAVVVKDSEAAAAVIDALVKGEAGSARLMGAPR